MKIAAALCFALFFAFSISCNPFDTATNIHKASSSTINQAAKEDLKSFPVVAGIPLPEGYERILLKNNSFSNWIRNLPLRKANIVYLYNGKPKANQRDNYAVVDISTGSHNLQQCADALMRLRAEYLASIKAYEEIRFVTSNGKELSFSKYAKGERYALVGQNLMSHPINIVQPSYDHKCLMQFLNVVFNYCSTYSLQLMCALKQLCSMMPGDMFVKAGSPGHAMMIADVAYNKGTGKKIYLLLQGYMPAQDIHIVRNPTSVSLSPWYEENENASIITPGWTFMPGNLRRW